VQDAESKVPELLLANATLPPGTVAVPVPVSDTVAVHVDDAFTAVEFGAQTTDVAVGRMAPSTTSVKAPSAKSFPCASSLNFRPYVPGGVDAVVAIETLNVSKHLLPFGTPYAATHLLAVACDGLPIPNEAGVTVTPAGTGVVPPTSEAVTSTAALEPWSVVTDTPYAAEYP
jgi:hypothetical protein